MKLSGHSILSSKGISLFLILYPFAVLGAYDPVNPPNGENIDPAEANPAMNLTCRGDRSELPEWVLRADGYLDESVQSLCAKPQYGGSLVTPNMGAFCFDEKIWIDIWHQTLLTYATTARHFNGWWRTMLYCRSRCFCNSGLADPNIQPKAVPNAYNTYSNAEHGSFVPRAYQITLDVEGASEPYVDNNPRTKIYLGNQPTIQQSIAHPEPNYNPGRTVEPVAILPDNKIYCRGDLPPADFPIPAPYTVADFANNQELCAVQLSGGLVGANAGAYCHRTDPTAALDDQGRVVSFVDDMTPRLEWTWAGVTGGFLVAAAVRFHCWKNCICSVPSRKPKQSDPLIPMWDWLFSAFPTQSLLPYTEGNANPDGSSTDADGEILTKNAVSGGADSQGCYGNDLGQCTGYWPADILGPIPAVIDALPKVITPIVAPSPPPKCLNRCEHRNDCAGTCNCAFPSAAEVLQFNLAVDPVFPPSFCLGLSLFGRSLENRNRECRCNGTYTGTSCCN